jgi:hypothetical protein
LADRLATMGEEQPHRLVDIDMGGIVVLDGAAVAHFPMADHVAERVDRPADAAFEETDFERGKAAGDAAHHERLGEAFMRRGKHADET